MNKNHWQILNVRQLGNPKHIPNKGNNSTPQTPLNAPHIPWQFEHTGLGTPAIVCFNFFTSQKYK
jgi:hypothetical protein